MLLGDFLAKQRHEMGVTLAYVCNKIDISTSHLHDIESNGQPRPKIEVLQKLAGFYGIDEDTLILMSSKIPPDVYWKVVRSQGLLKVIRDYKE